MTKDDIIALRRSLNLNQCEMASLLGVTQPTISRIESGANVTGPIRVLLEHFKNQTGANVPVQNLRSHLQPNGVE